MKKLQQFLLENRLLALIVLLAIALRFYALSANPPAMNWDEISHGYNAYSILKTGRDEWGKFLPTIFRAYGDYKLPVYIYLTAVSEAVFGLSAFAVRFPSALAGIATVVFTYLLAKKLFDRKVAAISALLVALEPWSFFLSRGAFEANLAVAFIVAGVYLFLTGLEKHKYLLVAAVLMGLSVWTYNSARIFVPLLLITLLLIYKNELAGLYRHRSRIIQCALLIILLFFVPMFYQLVRPVGQARYGKVAILDVGAIAQINELRARSKYPQVLSRIIYNKATYFASKFAAGYVSHFSPGFLFLRGGTQYQFSIPNRGLLYLIDIPFLLSGTYWLLRKRTKSTLVVLSWLILAPVPSSLTREAPQVLRAITMLPIPMLISALGIIFFLEKIPGNLKLLTTILYSIVVLAFLGSYLRSYFLDYPQNYSWSWQYGYKQAVEYTKANYSMYGKIIVTKKYGEPHEFFLFYWPWSPQKYQSDPGLVRFYQSEWYWVDRFDKFYFVNDWQIPKSGSVFVLESKNTVDCAVAKCLLITSPANFPAGWRKLEQINFLDGKGAFEIYAN